MFESWIMDARYAARRLLSRPAYAGLAVLTLALAAGGTAAIFSVVRALLLDPLPVAREEQVGVLWFSGSWREQEFLGLRPQFPGLPADGRIPSGGPDPGGSGQSRCAWCRASPCPRSSSTCWACRPTSDARSGQAKTWWERNRSRF